MWRLSFALSKNFFPQPSCGHWNYKINKGRTRTNLSPWTVRCFLSDALSLNTLPHDSRWQENVLYWDYLLTFPRMSPPFPDETPVLSPTSPDLKGSLWWDRPPPLILLMDGAPVPLGLRPLPPDAGSREMPFPRWRFLSKWPSLFLRCLDPKIPPDRTKFKLIII